MAFICSQWLPRLSQTAATGKRYAKYLRIALGRIAATGGQWKSVGTRAKILGINAGDGGYYLGNHSRTACCPWLLAQAGQKALPKFPRTDE